MKRQDQKLLGGFSEETACGTKSVENIFQPTQIPFRHAQPQTTQRIARMGDGQSCKS